MSACWHRYVSDVDGTEFCERCGDCPAERRAEEIDAMNERNRAEWNEMHATGE